MAETVSRGRSVAAHRTMIFIIAMVLGIIVGAISYACGPAVGGSVNNWGSLVPDLFLRLIKMIIAPLVFTTLVAGVGAMRDGRQVRRIGIRVMIWFVVMSFVSLGLGLLLANIIRPGVGFTQSLPAAGAQLDVAGAEFHLRSFLLNIVPVSAVEAMSSNNILQLVVFSVFCGLALAQLPENYSKPVFDVVDGSAHVILRVTEMIMGLVPLVIFASLAASVAHSGLGIILKYGLFLIEFYGCMLLMCMITIAAGFMFLGRQVFQLLKLVSEPLMLGFATASGEAAYPALLEQLEEFGVPVKISSFVLPLGYSFNLTGSMMFQSFAAIFIAQAYGIEMTLGQQIAMLLVMLISSKGIASVPRAALAMLTAVMPQFGIPAAGLILILGIDQFLDMARTATNITGNVIAAAVASKWNDDDERRDREKAAAQAKG